MRHFSCRDDLIWTLARPPYGLSARQICGLNYEDVVEVDPYSSVDTQHSSPQYDRQNIHLRSALRLGRFQLPMGPELRWRLLDYLQGDTGRPFHAYRPYIGRSLFPSAQFTGPISHFTVVHALRAVRANLTVAVERRPHQGEEGGDRNQETDNACD